MTYIYSRCHGHCQGFSKIIISLVTVMALWFIFVRVRLCCVMSARQSAKFCAAHTVQESVSSTLGCSLLLFLRAATLLRAYSCLPSRPSSMKAVHEVFVVVCIRRESEIIGSSLKVWFKNEMGRKWFLSRAVDEMDSVMRLLVLNHLELQTYGCGSKCVSYGD